MGIVVCDNGTGFVKVGWATSNAPDYTFPSIVGKPMLRADTVANLSTIGSIPKASGAVAGKLLRGEWLVGEEAELFRDCLDITHPMENGVIREWAEMEAIWRHAFSLLGLPDQEAGRGHHILLTEPPLNPKQNRERMVRMMLEVFKFERVHVAVQATLVLYSQGLTTGVVVDSGDGVTHMVPVFEGVCPQHLVRRIDLAGRDITRQLVKLLQLSGYQFNRTSDFEQIRLMKEAVCYIAPEYRREVKLAGDTTHVNADYQLPDGRTVVLRQERFQAPEILFDPSRADKECAGVAECLFECIMAADIDLRAALFKHVVLSGGTTTVPGFKDRLESDLRRIYGRRVTSTASASPLHKIKVYDPDNRKHAVFTGGAVLAELMRTSDAFWVSQAEWSAGGAGSLCKWRHQV